MIGVHTKNKEYIDNFLGELRRRKVSDIRVTTIKNRLKHTLDTKNNIVKRDIDVKKWTEEARIKQRIQELEVKDK